MKKTPAFILLTLLLLLPLSCGQRGGRSSDDASRPFPMVEVPVMLTDEAERLDFVLSHYWDAFFGGDGPTDSGRVLGVRNSEIEKNVARYISLLDNVPMDVAQARLQGVFSQIEARQTLDTASLFYQLMTETFSDYLYDPNSPLRSEDYYLPFVEGMTASRFTSEDRRAGYRFELEKCRLNPYGSKVPDFYFKDIRDRRHHLYGVQADYTMLFFSNPGCHSCQEIIEQIGSRPYIDHMIEEGTLAIVNVYIDEEVDKWREYEPNYPRNWLNGYDFGGVINGGELYYVRAIPSLYLLDSQKRVIYKDVPVEKVLLRFDALMKENDQNR